MRINIGISHTGERLWVVYNEENSNPIGLIQGDIVDNAYIGYPFFFAPKWRYEYLSDIDAVEGNLQAYFIQNVSFS